MKRNNNKKYGYEQQQTQIQETAHEMELALDTLYNCLEALEEYIGKTGHYSDWDNKRQIYRKTIKDSNYTLEGFEDVFLTQLFIVKGSLLKKPEFFCKEVQKAFHKWINATGIDENNCPERLKHFLFEINEVLEGRGDNIVNQTKELIKDRELTTDEALGFFGKLQEPMNKNRERGSLLEGKNWDEAENRNRIGGNFERGEEAFGQISQGFSSKHTEFDLFSEQKKRRGIQSSTSPQQRTNSEIVQDVKNNPQNWRIDEVITGYDNYGRATEKQLALIHNSAEVGYDGAVPNLQSQPIYLISRFSQGERINIERALNIAQTPTNQPIRQELVNNIKQHKNEFRTERVVVSDDGQNYNEENWIIHNSAQMKSDKNGCLVFDSDKMVKVKDLNDAEKEAIGYKSEVGLQTNSSSTPKNDDKGIGKGGIITIISVASVLAIAGVVVRKKLNKKVKK